MPLQDYEDAMSVDAGSLGRTPLPKEEDLMEEAHTKTEGIVPISPPTPSLFLTLIFEDPIPEPPVPSDKHYFV